MERVQFALQKQLKGAFDLSELKLSEQVLTPSDALAASRGPQGPRAACDPTLN